MEQNGLRVGGLIGTAVASWLDGRMTDAQTRLDAIPRRMFDVAPFRFSRHGVVLDWAVGQNSAQLAADLTQFLKTNGRRTLVKAAWFVTQPNEAQALSLAEALLPAPYGATVEVLRDAIIIAGSTNAAQKQAAEQRVVVNLASYGAREFLADFGPSPFRSPGY